MCRRQRWCTTVIRMLSAAALASAHMTACSTQQCSAYFNCKYFSCTREHHTPALRTSSLKTAGCTARAAGDDQHMLLHKQWKVAHLPSLVFHCCTSRCTQGGLSASLVHAPNTWVLNYAQVPDRASSSVPHLSQLRSHTLCEQDPHFQRLGSVHNLCTQVQ